MINVYTESGLFEAARPASNARVRLKELKFSVDVPSTIIITTNADFKMVSVGFGTPQPPPSQGGSLQVGLALRDSSLGNYISVTQNLARITFSGNGSTQAYVPVAATHTVVNVSPGKYLAVVDVFTDPAAPETVTVRQLTVIVIAQ